MLEWCASCNFDTTRTALVREMCDCIDDLKYADDEDVDEMIVEWKPLAAQSFKKKLALLKSGFSGEGAAALNQPGAFASGFSAAPAAAPPSPRQGRDKADEDSSDDASSEDERPARKRKAAAAKKKAPKKARAAPKARRAPAKKQATGDRRLATQVYSEAELWAAPKPQLGDLGDVVLARSADAGRCAKCDGVHATADCPHFPRDRELVNSVPISSSRCAALEGEPWSRTATSRDEADAPAPRACDAWRSAGSTARVQALLDRDARIAVAQPNPKAPGTLSHARYEAYAAATTCSEFLDLGGRRDDLKHDLAKGFVVVVGPGHGRSRVSSDVADDTDDDDGVIDLGPPAEDKALDAEVAGLLAGGDGDDDALLTISL